MQTLLEVGLANAVMASALAVLAAVACFFCRRPAVRHTLWLLVLLKLVTPPVLSLPIHCPSALLKLFANQDVSSSAHASSELDPADSHQAAALDAANQEEDGEILGLPYPSSPAPEAVSQPAVSSQPWLTTTYPLDRAIPTFSALVFTVWLTGAALWFAVALTRIYCFQRLLRFGRAAPPLVQDQAGLLAARLGLARCPTVWLVPGRVSPLLWALGRNLSLVVPADLLYRLKSEQCACLLAHELAHARRRDHWARWLEFVVSGLYWWLPVAWWARRQLQQAEEECCDAWVVWTLPAAAKAYAKALLQTVDFLDARPALPPVASGIGHVHLLKRRLAMIVRQPFCPQLPWPVHLGVIVLGLLVLPLAPERLVAQNPEAKPVPELAAGTALVQVDRDSSDRDVERRLRALEEKMDRLMQKLDAQREERSEKRPAEASPKDNRARAKEQAEKARVKARAAADIAREKAEKARQDARAAAAEQRARARKLAEVAKQKLKTEKTIDAAQIQQALDAIQGKYRKELEPQLRELQKRIQETVDKNLSPKRMEEIQRKVEDALKKSTQQLNEALKRSTEELGRAQNSLREAERARAREPRSEKSSSQEQRDLERRMDRLEKKMDRVIQALEKSGKSSRREF